MAETETMKFIKENEVHSIKFTKPRTTDIGSYTCETADPSVRTSSQEIRVSSKFCYSLFKDIVYSIAVTLCKNMLPLNYF